MNKFSGQLTEVELNDLEIGELVLVVNTQNAYEPFIGRVDVNRSNMSWYGNKVITDVNIPEDFVGLSEEDTMIFKVIV